VPGGFPAVVSSDLSAPLAAFVGTTAEVHTMTKQPDWTPLDQARADSFARQVLQFAASMPGHPDAVVIAFVQATGSLMRQRLGEDPTRAAEYARMLDMLQTHVAQAIPPTSGGDTTH
jgi:hypothetical protein